MSEGAKRERSVDVIVPRDLVERLLRDLDWLQENEGWRPKLEADQFELQRILR